eukprot:CAMPEP_0204333528 /NCGR_PEP_ID=MMETSP0469-20131031/17297_1 /ASSEMBLY_ACC=CAM_ASM_000384 /TAXON_ID=2969 /ORGANISM="Oxyrrhis marina" /LENGTH=116 /DNA_ID=CAMNT_0051316883 /DNA_START=317 /DNA_END=667 /DNA_ORIENTATION=+
MQNALLMKRVQPILAGQQLKHIVITKLRGAYTTHACDRLILGRLGHRQLGGHGGLSGRRRTGASHLASRRRPDRSLQLTHTHCAVLASASVTAPTPQVTRVPIHRPALAPPVRLPE